MLWRTILKPPSCFSITKDDHIKGILTLYVVCIILHTSISSDRILFYVKKWVIRGRNSEHNSGTLSIIVRFLNIKNSHSSENCEHNVDNPRRDPCPLRGSSWFLQVRLVEILFYVYSSFTKLSVFFKLLIIPVDKEARCKLLLLLHVFPQVLFSWGATVKVEVDRFIIYILFYWWKEVSPFLPRLLFITGSRQSSCSCHKLFPVQLLEKINNKRIKTKTASSLMCGK